MEEPLTCLQCGKCCFVDLTAYAEPSDFDRWRTENRQDILKFIEQRHLTWSGDRMISTDTGNYPRECPFLINAGQKWLCSIYETRPRVCRSYKPGSSELCPQYSINGRQKRSVA
ncbi:MAG: hypothetical protein CVU54_07385 [Deltaproteobacteria bacterium HGW-Deltaproteobacteria-12]|jgi:Fe-S-cluster containining protein|nr:MAG: hypothetical protein CVU54_07385 [Deltaproteobacteria bacterium HGW-Deltaproteobacteria-12]